MQDLTPENPENPTLTSVTGIRVGHAEAPGGHTGCTVVLGPFRAAVEVAGMATGSRELHVLDLEHLVPEVDAILLTGGSAFGLAAADGVSAWLAERQAGYLARVHRVPIVVAAVIFDLVEGLPRPDAELGWAACKAASGAPVPMGRVGAGSGATVGNLGGPGGLMPGGVGTRAVRVQEWTVGALAVVNALGDVLDASGRIVAGARGPDGAFLDSARLLRTAGAAAVNRPVEPGSNTTLAVVAVDAPLSKVDLRRVARLAGTALPRRVSPVCTPFDGDLVFVISPVPGPRPTSPEEILALGVAARDALEEAITAAVVPGTA